MTENFDWVRALSECSVGAVFETLRQQVKRDVEIRQGLRTEHVHYGFQFISTSTNSFSVMVEGNKVHDTVWFERKENEIAVHGEEGIPSFSGTLTLNADGECRVKVEDSEYELWQIRKMALERLFFRSY